MAVIVILLLLVAGLAVFDVIAMSFGADSRELVDDSHAGNRKQGAI